MIHRYRRVLLVLGALLVACATPAFAGIPYGGNSTIPARLVACPLGDAEYRVVVRDIANFPVPGCLVQLDFSNCAGATFCPVQPAGVTWNPTTRRASVTSDANGVAAFHLKMGGVCPGVSIPVIACGVVLNSGGLNVFVASPDQDGNLIVAGPDVLIVNGLLGTASPQADFDDDGLVEADDLAFVTDQHPAHACDDIIPAHPWTWGTLKQHYR